VGPTPSAPKQAHRAGIICDDLVLSLLMALARMKTIKQNAAGG
jgi:hypothetical protein